MLTGKIQKYLLSPPVEHIIHPHENPKYNPLESQNFFKKNPTLDNFKDIMYIVRLIANEH